MKNRPKFWYELPFCIMDDIARKVELCYNPYKSSYDEILANVLNQHSLNYRNSKIVQEYYETISDEGLQKLYFHNLRNLESRIEELKQYLK
ncbi:MAG: hypothetical protein AABY22_07115 [Nanoarchaeota archaeon]